MTGTLDITEVDPFDAAAVDDWHGVYFAAYRHGRDPEVATVWTLEEFRVFVQDQHARKFSRGWTGRVDGRPVVAGGLEGSNLDNLGLAEAWVATAPDERGRGYGSELLEHLEGVARSMGRTTLNGIVNWPYDADPQGVGVPVVGFARKRGYVVGLVDVQRQLRLPVDAALLDRLAAEAAPHHEGYTLRSFVGPVPDDLVQSWVDLSSSLMTEAPMGEMEREPERTDVAAYRAMEDLVRKQGRTKFNTVAISAQGEVVAYTDIACTVHESTRAYQWGTLVRGDHRGHRLGLAVKVANLRLLQDHAPPQVRTVITYNAEVNEHMVGVNEQLGFRPTERDGELQKKLT